jgi:hypothetical protein
MDINKIIKLLRQYTKEHKSEIGEQDGETTTAAAAPTPSTPPASSGGGASGGSQKYPAVTKWESGVSRGPANQIGNTKWSDIVKLNRGKANPIDQKSKWSSGVARGKGNTLL